MGPVLLSGQCLIFPPSATLLGFSSVNAAPKNDISKFMIFFLLLISSNTVQFQSCFIYVELCVITLGISFALSSHHLAALF